MGTLVIKFYADSKQNKVVFGERRPGGAEDSSTSTTAETVAIPAGAVYMKVSAVDGGHVFGFGSGSTGAAGTRDYIKSGDTEVHEVPTAYKAGDLVEYKAV